MPQINVVLVDDHTLFAKALKTLISSFEDIYVNHVASNGQDFIDYISDATQIPDVVLLDVRMPRMNGIETMKWIEANHPEINVLAITMEDDDDTISKMIHNGCKGYLLKDVEPQILNTAIRTVATGAFVYTDMVGRDVFEASQLQRDTPVAIQLTEKEQEFLNYVCGSDLSYKEIGSALNLSKGAIDNRRESLFTKLGVNSRISAVLCAVEHKLVTV